ncbi:hypothetical protein [Brevundimonas sp. Bb-A]|uniref:hypothetical protein n=1 Tax=Brevundimonas sp. Bb-A TaxID=2560058 RepID=UPI00128FBEE2|nr:hypothetical protein [Brevundimonas sp. Bb-A]QFU30256.1 hypothetical protein BSP_01135 [Brevundimonas sp. Bb-A]
MIRAALTALAPWALAAVVGALLWTWTPLIGPAARYARLESDRDAKAAAAKAWEAHGRGWMASFHAAEGIRRDERQNSRMATEQLAAQCDARVAQARQSARVIERIVTKEPTYDETRCPVRSLVDPGELRRALQPAD